MRLDTSPYVSSSLIISTFPECCQTTETSRKEEKQSQNGTNLKWIQFLVEFTLNIDFKYFNCA